METALLSPFSFGGEMVEFKADHYFHIGSSHYRSGKPCQDYALSRSGSGVAFAAVSDGCSSGRHTDIGARLQVLSAMRAMAKVDISHVPQVFAYQEREILKYVSEELGLELDDTLATCGYLYLDSQRGFVHVVGDGVVAKKYRNGEIRMHKLEWQMNTPYYPAYIGEHLKRFVNAHGGDMYSLCLRNTVATISESGVVVSESLYDHTLASGIEGMKFEIYDDDRADLEFLAIFTDGVTQISGLDWREAVRRFLSFRSIEGEFVKRRMIRELKDLQKAGHETFDDISCAVIRISSESQVKEDNHVRISS
jgi:hypothetical protein